MGNGQAFETGQRKITESKMQSHTLVSSLEHLSERYSELAETNYKKQSILHSYLKTWYL